MAIDIKTILLLDLIARKYSLRKQLLSVIAQGKLPFLRKCLIKT